MLVAERHQKIIEIVNERESIRVSELSQIFNVTEETIRRDLGKLEKEGKLLRSHGGAVKVEDAQPEIPFFTREMTNVKAKKEIALQAISFIEAKDRIILDASTTALYMAKNLPDIPLTILTNSIKVAMELASKEKIEVVSTGGILLSRSLSFVGPLAERSLDLYHVNKAFISCKGFHTRHGISESNELQTLVKRKMIDIADQIYLLVDYSKFGVQAFTHVAGLREIDVVITDSNTTEAYLSDLRHLSVHTIQAKTS